jgi:hypothetical protein
VGYALQKESIFIRINQLGFLPNDIKTGVIFSEENLEGVKFSVIDQKNQIPVYRSTLSQKLGSDKNYHYFRIDFSEVDSPGKYYIDIIGKHSYDFIISNDIYNDIVDSLLLFFKVQRCGFTDPFLHDVCHFFDATSLIVDGERIEKRVDVSGGWHDAGDYIKFLNTTAYTTYTLLFTYIFDSTKFESDRDDNKIPDILDEAKIGLDWLLKLIYKGERLIIQVQDLRDHEQEWRKPEEDTLVDDRPAFVGSGKNLIGIYTATMALAYRLWKDFPGYSQFANRCLKVAENLYQIHNEIPDLDISGTGAYQDSHYLGKLALGSVELYLATGKDKYLQNAKIFATKAKSDYWWSWGDINAYAHYHLARIDPQFKFFIYRNLKYFNELKEKHFGGEAVVDSWGSNNVNLGVALQAILWKDLTGENTFEGLATSQRDFLLGKNQWGISFVYNIGTHFSQYFHSQVAYFNNGYLPGAVAAGPIGMEKLKNYAIPYEKSDPFFHFQTDSSVYRDDRMDYITNEPTITANATAVFVMGYYSKRGKKRTE